MNKLDEIDSPDHDVSEDDILFLIDLARAGMTLAKCWSCMCGLSPDNSKCPGCTFNEILRKG
jgi:hypothetical protein